MAVRNQKESYTAIYVTITLLLVFLGAFFIYKIKRINKNYHKALLDQKTSNIPIPASENEETPNDIITRNLEFPKSWPNLIENKDFKINGQIAKGGGGMVFEGKILNRSMKTELGTSDCIIKKMIVKKNNPEQDDLAEYQKTSKRFQQEVAFIYFFCQHKNFAPIYGFNFEKSEIIMKYFIYGSYSDYLKEAKDRGVNARIISKILRDIINGIKFMHMNDVVHNDIKPSNVLLDKDINGYIFAVLTDFGVAQVIKNSDVPSVKNFNCLVVDGLSPNYASPEALVRGQEREKIDMLPKVYKANDIYCFGSTIYESLNQSPPWNETEGRVHEIMNKILTGLRPEMSERGVRIIKNDRKLEKLYDIMLLCWMQDPQRRPSANEVYKLLIIHGHLCQSSSISSIGPQTKNSSSDEKEEMMSQNRSKMLFSKLIEETKLVNFKTPTPLPLPTMTKSVSLDSTSKYFPPSKSANDLQYWGNE
jgi:serine/threonine protein kinase